MDIWLLLLVLLILTYIVAAAYKVSRRFEKWGIPQAPELPFLGFTFSNFFPRFHVNTLCKRAYDSNKEAKYIGCHLFLSPVIMLRDPELIKCVLVKNFDHFADHKAFVDKTLDPLFGLNLVFLNGDRWREVRSLLSPAFTASKMRSMFTLMLKCAENFGNHFLSMCNDVENNIDIKDAFSRYTNDVIATCAFGIEIDSLKNLNNEFYVHGKAAASFKGLRQLKMMLIMALPKLTTALGFKMISSKQTKFFVNLIDTTMQTRKERGIVRPDMLQLMMDASDHMDLELIDMTAQAFIFFLAGFETSSVQMCLIAHELAANPEVQEKLQEEIDASLEQCGGKLNYEIVNNMSLLDAVFKESLRLHSNPFLSRVCSKEFELPPALPGSRPFLMKPGMEVIVPVSGIHHDPEYYDNHDKFYPERYLNKKAALSDVMNLGFGLGPRMCIGNRFAILETKILFTYLLSKYNFAVCDKTCLPLQYDPNNFSPVPKRGFWLRIESRT